MGKNTEGIPPTREFTTLPANQASQIGTVNLFGAVTSVPLGGDGDAVRRVL